METMFRAMAKEEERKEMEVRDVPLLQRLRGYGMNGKKVPIKGVEVGSLIQGYRNLIELIPDTNTICLAEPLAIERRPLTHKRLRSFILREFDLGKFGLPKGARVAILLPNGPELAVTIVSVVSQWCAAPINPTATWQEIRSELQSTRARAIIIKEGSPANDAVLEACRSLSIGVIIITPTETDVGLFRLNVLIPVPAPTHLVFVSPSASQNSPTKGASGNSRFQSFGHPDTVLLLHTSGTSGNKKLVPYSLDMIIIGVGCIVSSWNLTPKDCCLNMMPLFHIGGIVRNIFSPLLSGGSVIACAGFDPLLFWDILQQGYEDGTEDLSASGFSSVASGSPLHASGSPSSTLDIALQKQGQGHIQPKPTWYYAAPTMHHAILTEAENRPRPLPVQRVRFIANAAGGLLPVLAEALRDTFEALILTSYGMTECMPISSPPQTYALHPIGTSGTAVGPSILIADDDLKPLPSGVAGNIFIKGAPCFAGYENNSAANDESFFVINGEAGWFNTGDCGSLDANGYLFISGRSKEIINRGGETISPLEIEEVVVQHPCVKETLAFSAPHDQFQEAVGAVIVTRPNRQRIDLPTLHRYLDGKLHRSKWPQVLVFMNALPKNAAGKILRIKLADRFGMMPVDEESSPLSRLFEAVCPPQGAALTLAIPLQPIVCSSSNVERVLKQQHEIGVVDAAVVKVDLPFHLDALVGFVVLSERAANELTLHEARKEQNQSQQSSAGKDKSPRGSRASGTGVSALHPAMSLHHICMETLPHYMVPAFIHVLTTLPRRVDDNSPLSTGSATSDKSSNTESLGSPLRNRGDSGGTHSNGSDDQTPTSVTAIGSIGAMVSSVGSTIASTAAVATTLRLGSEDTVDRVALSALALQLHTQRNVVMPRNAIETQIELVWREQLRAASVLSVVKSFFDLGGDSLKAGQLVNAMRKKLRVQLSVSDLFTAPTIESLAHKVSTFKALGSPGLGTPSVSTTATSSQAAKRKEKLGSSPLDDGSPGDESLLGDGAASSSGSTKTRNHGFVKWGTVSPLSSTAFPCLFVQALPIAILFPMRKIVNWFLVAWPWIELMKIGMGRFRALLCAIVISRVALGILAPLTGIIAKWVIIGRYKPGKYPLWGGMYLRWWIVEQIINIAGRGMFRDDLPIIGSHLVRLYYVLMGASIGNNVKIHKDARIGQADLLCIGDDVIIDNATVSPFSLEEGHFVLLPIRIGDRCALGVKSIVAASSTLQPGTCIGPLSSSHEIDDAETHYRNYCRTAYQQPPALLIVFVGIPILALVTGVAFIPWYLGLHLMVFNAKAGGWYESEIHSIFHAFLWWITPQRLFYYFLLRIIRRCLVPPLRLLLVICIKKLFIGKFEPLDAAGKDKAWYRLRYWIMNRLLPGGNLGGVSRLVGTHYEIISMVYRALGAKIGKRVYWPGSGLEIVEYDLLSIGDDVVFGSRSVVLTSSAVRSAPVVFEAGSMVADRCVVLPGVKLRKGAVLGSGSLVTEDMDVDVGSVWVGSQGGQPVNAAPADLTYKVKDTLTPFGRAFYEKEAPYWVCPLWLIVIYNTVWQAFCTCYRNCPTALSLIICSYVLAFDHYDDHSPLELFKLTLFAFVPLHALLAVTALGIDIGGKWALLGRRLAGAYPWDQSSYCQRWQMYLTLQEIRRGERRKTGLLDMMQGSQYLVWYFRALGARIGHDVCLYPNGASPMMTEPDLVNIGDRAAVDDASLIAHINTRGIFRLHPLVVGDGCVLKAMTRLLSGASMESHSLMLEHTLVMAGEVVDCGSVWQGWPVSTQIPLEKYRAELESRLDRDVRLSLSAGRYYQNYQQQSTTAFRERSREKEREVRNDRGVDSRQGGSPPGTRRRSVEVEMIPTSSELTSTVAIKQQPRNVSFSKQKQQLQSRALDIESGLSRASPEKQPLLSGNKSKSYS